MRYLDAVELHCTMFVHVWNRMEGMNCMVPCMKLNGGGLMIQ